MFPELYVEFDPGKPPVVTFHEDNDKSVDLSPLQRKELIELFLLRDFFQAESHSKTDEL